MTIYLFDTVAGIWEGYLMQPTTTNWTWSEMNGEHAAMGLAFHPEAVAFRGGSLADMFAAATAGFVLVVSQDEAPVSSATPTVKAA